MFQNYYSALVSWFQQIYDTSCHVMANEDIRINYHKIEIQSKYLFLTPKISSWDVN